MDHSLFKFACNVSSRLFKKNFSSISRCAFKSPFIIRYQYNNNLDEKKAIQNVLTRSYLHTNAKYFCKSHEIFNNEVTEELSSESSLPLDVKHNVDNSPAINVKKNVLEPSSDNIDVNMIAPHIKPTFNLAAYADKSTVLKHLIQLGVEIGLWDKNKEICTSIINKNFETDIKPYVFFLREHGVSPDKIGYFITRNPHIFEHSLENIQIRINYLESRKFSKENITFIINQSPKWLNYNVIDVDRQLGNFKKKFKLLHKEVIELATRDSKLILYTIENPFNIELHTRTIDGRLGFTMKQQKELLLGYPRIYRTNITSLTNRFDVIHGEMKLSHEVMVKYPMIFGFRERKLQERHRFLNFLGRAQYDPTKPGYVSPKSFVSGNDAEFSINVAASSVEIMNDFLKTL